MSDGAPALRRLSDGRGLEALFTDVGATWRSCRLRLADGSWRELLLDAEQLEPRPAYIGSTIGRYANRIANGRLERDGRAWQLRVAPGQRHQLHGGPGGFHARAWTCTAQAPGRIAWQLQSPEGDQGFPGALDVTLEVRIPEPGCIEWRCAATATAWSPFAPTCHAYFNLDGGGDVLAHRLQVAADRYAPVDEELIPLGPLAAVDGTTVDFREERVIGPNCDHGLLLRPGAPWAARLCSGDGRVGTSITTNAPALQVYAGRHLAGIARSQRTGGGTMPACAGVALEPGWLPDSPNRPQWPQPSCWLGPGERRELFIRYRFEAAARPQPQTGTHPQGAVFHPVPSPPPQP
ncbi:MAG TPA: galactose-1-epimerase [Ramlibacter sp.]|nr:galactose-1-epimerase [Ramlibacter sp.]